MTINELQLEKFLFSSLLNSNKDKVLSIRIEESMHELLQDLAKELETETVSDTVRKILNFYLINAIYEAEWEKLHSKDFQNFLEEVAEAGDTIEIDRFKRLLEEFSEYMDFLKSIAERVNHSIIFFEQKTEELEQVISRLEHASILWNGKKYSGETENVK
jgi:hypothetical protein